MRSLGGDIPHIRTGTCGGCCAALIFSYLIGACVGMFFPDLISVRPPEAVYSAQMIGPYLWYFFRFLLLAFLLSFTALGVVGFPILLAFRGCLIGSAAAVLASTGTITAYPEFMQLGLTSAASLLGLFLISCRGMPSACAAFSVLIGKRRSFLLPSFVVRQLAFLAAGVLLIITACAAGFAAEHLIGS